MRVCPRSGSGLGSRPRPRRTIFNEAMGAAVNTTLATTDTILLRRKIRTAEG
jgi:hypothetical protein